MFCPKCQKVEGVIRRGIYQRISDQKKIQRFTCKVCNIRFSEQTFAIEGPLYTPQNGSSLEARIQALGTVDGVDLSSATVTATKLGILTAAAVA